MRQAKSDLTEQIFLATDRLMAKEGLNQLSMHKLAKEANIAAGTIYLYFKNKKGQRKWATLKSRFCNQLLSVAHFDRTFD